MDLWELEAREAIRDLIGRYNANGDAGRFAEVLELFAPDASMAVEGVTSVGLDEIAAIFTSTQAAVVATDAPVHVRHFTGTLQIDVVDESTATSRCYFQVLTPVGVDHWGRYVDRYRVVDGEWRFARRTVTIDGRNPDSIFSFEIGLPDG